MGYEPKESDGVNVNMHSAMAHLGADVVRTTTMLVSAAIIERVPESRAEGIDEVADVAVSSITVLMTIFVSVELFYHTSCFRRWPGEDGHADKFDKV